MLNTMYTMEYGSTTFAPLSKPSYLGEAGYKLLSAPAAEQSRERPVRSPGPISFCEGICGCVSDLRSRGFSITSEYIGTVPNFLDTKCQLVTLSCAIC
jgi:hypothetical protein